MCSASDVQAANNASVTCTREKKNGRWGEIDISGHFGWRGWRKQSFACNESRLAGRPVRQIYAGVNYIPHSGTMNLATEVISVAGTSTDAGLINIVGLVPSSKIGWRVGGMSFLLFSPL
jgi:hypothetical protein